MRNDFRKGREHQLAVDSIFGCDTYLEAACVRKAAGDGPVHDGSLECAARVVSAAYLFDHSSGHRADEV